MRFQGRIYRTGKHWIADVPVFDALTQGRNRKEVLDMISDWFASMVNRPRFTVRVHAAGNDEIEIESDDTRAMISLLLQRQRHKSGLSLSQVAERLGARSKNAYARYEQGVSVPTVDKLDQLLRAVAPDRDIVVRESAAA
jgi:predicted transcriptional regulator